VGDLIRKGGGRSCEERWGGWPRAGKKPHGEDQRNLIHKQETKGERKQGKYHNVSLKDEKICGVVGGWWGVGWGIKMQIKQNNKGGGNERGGSKGRLKFGTSERSWEGKSLERS